MIQVPAHRTLVVVEDAQLLDTASAELLDTALGSPAARGWAAVVARRPGEEGLRVPEREGTRPGRAAARP